MSEPLFTITDIFTGKTKPLGDKNFVSSIRRDANHESLYIGKEEINKNNVTNVRHHGGPDRIVHQYALENFNHLKQQFPEIKEKFVPGSIGENITTIGATEAELRVGDKIRLGEVLLEITEPRMPCGVINMNYEIKGIFEHVKETGRVGWFYRVLEPGTITIGDTSLFEERGEEEFNLLNVYLQTIATDKDKVYLKRLHEYAPLSTRWRESLQRFI